MSDEDDNDVQAEDEGGIEVHCAHCDDPWVISKQAFDEATSIIVREFPEDSIVAMPVNVGYLCPKCHQAHRDDPLAFEKQKPSKKRKPSRKH